MLGQALQEESGGLVNNKALFTIKMVFLLAVIVGLCAIVMNSNAEPLQVMSVQARGGLNVREEPKVDSTATYLLQDTETVIVLEWQNGWALVAKNISPDMVLGWVCGKYLR